MLLNPSDLSLAQSAEKALRRLSGELHGHTGPEPHAPAIELATGIHSDVVGTVAELAVLRALLDGKPRAMGLIAASAAIPPLACSGETRVSGSARRGGCRFDANGGPRRADARLATERIDYCPSRAKLPPKARAAP